MLGPYFVIAIVLFGMAVTILFYYRSDHGMQTSNYSGPVTTDHTGPVTMKTGGYWIRQLNLSYPGPVDVSIDSIVPDWTNLEEIKKTWI